MEKQEEEQNTNINEDEEDGEQNNENNEKITIRMEKQEEEQNTNINEDEEDGEQNNENNEKNGNNDENEDGEIHPPEDGNSPERAPRYYTNSGAVLTVSNAVSQNQPFTGNTSDENSHQSLDISNTAIPLFSFAGSRELAHDSLTIEPDLTIHGSPRKIFSDLSDTSGYSEPITGEDDDDQQYNQKRNNKNAKGRAQSTRQNRNANNKGDKSNNLSKTQKNNRNQSQTNPTSRRKQYDGDKKNPSHALLGSSSGSISGSSSNTSIPTSEISVSTLNPSDYSENFTPDMQNVLSPRFSNQQQASKPLTQNKSTSQSARGLRSNTNSKYPPVVKVKQPLHGSQSKSFNNSRPSPPSRRRQNSNANTQSSFNTTANTTASSSRRRRPLYLPPIKEEIPEPTEEMKKLIDRAIAKDKFDDLQEAEFEDLIYSLQQERRRKASDRSFSMGEKINEAIKYVKNCQLTVQKAARLKQATEEYNKEFEEFKALVQEFDDDTQREKEDLKEQLNQQRQNILDSQQAQIAELREHWTSTNKVRMYNHASNDLTAMKKKRKLLLMQARFNEAQEIDHLIKEKKKVEESTNHESYQQGFDAALRNLQEKQKEELSFFDENAKIQIDKLIQRRERLRVGYNNQFKKFAARAELLKDADKLWNSEQFSRRDNMNTKMMMGARAGQPSGRILANDVQETEDGDNAALELPPLDLREKTEKKKEPKKKKKANPEEEDEFDVGDETTNEIPNE